MKNAAINLTFSLILLSAFSGYGKIKNGYGGNIPGSRLAHAELKKMLEIPSLSKDKRSTVLESLSRIESLIIYFEITDRLMERFRLIAPDIYNRIDTIKSADGTEVDVYIKFLDQSDMPFNIAGTVNLDQDKENLNAYTSVYGINTVSVRIAISRKSLETLAHEFGHISYQVPNLAKYVVLHNERYLSGDHNVKAEGAGHGERDPSGMEAEAFEKIFAGIDFQKENPKRIAANISKMQLYTSFGYQLDNTAQLQKGNKSPQ